MRIIGSAREARGTWRFAAAAVGRHGRCVLRCGRAIPAGLGAGRADPRGAEWNRRFPGFVERRFEKQRERRVGIIGRIGVEKGQAEFLRAAAALVEGGSRARFVICGAPLFGDRGYYDQVLRLASGLPVEFLDWQDDIGGVMRDLDVLAIPSEHEGMPRVLLEAFSSGLPVVAFPVGGIPEVIENGVTGFLAGELTATLREVLEADPERLRAVAGNARRAWERHYTVARYRERITALMEQCVPRGAPETAAPPRHRSATLR